MFDFVQQEARLRWHVIRRYPRDDRGEACCCVSFQQTRAFLRRAENSEEVAELFLGLFKETFHPLPTLVPGAFALGFKIESRK